MSRLGILFLNITDSVLFSRKKPIKIPNYLTVKSYGQHLWKEKHGVPMIKTEHLLV